MLSMSLVLSSGICFHPSVSVGEEGGMIFEFIAMWLIVKSKFCRRMRTLAVCICFRSGTFRSGCHTDNQCFWHLPLPGEGGVSSFRLFFVCFQGCCYHYIVINNDQAQGHRLQNTTTSTDFDPFLTNGCCWTCELGHSEWKTFGFSPICTKCKSSGHVLIVKIKSSWGIIIQEWVGVWSKIKTAET